MFFKNMFMYSHSVVSLYIETQMESHLNVILIFKIDVSYYF
jgi:hypothetical protein